MRKNARNMVATTILALAALLGLGSAPASAATVSYLYNGGGSVPVYYAPNTTYSNVKVWAPSGTRFRMICWLDNAGHRWFYGQEYSRGAYGYATAGVVKNQTSVGHC